MAEIDDVFSPSPHRSQGCRLHALLASRADPQLRSGITRPRPCRLGSVEAHRLLATRGSPSAPPIRLAPAAEHPYSRPLSSTPHTTRAPLHGVPVSPPLLLSYPNRAPFRQPSMGGSVGRSGRLDEQGGEYHQPKVLLGMARYLESRQPCSVFRLSATCLKQRVDAVFISRSGCAHRLVTSLSSSSPHRDDLIVSRTSVRRRTPDD